MKVEVRVYAGLRRVLGGKNLIVKLEEGARVKDLVLELGGKFEASGNVLLGGLRLAEASLIVLVNGRNINSLNGPDTVLREGDLVAFMPVTEGGQPVLNSPKREPVVQPSDFLAYFRRLFRRF